MPWNIKNWRRRHILKSEPIPDDSWGRVVARLGFLRGLSPDELQRLRECVALFLHSKQISGAHGLVVTHEMRLLIIISNGSDTGSLHPLAASVTMMR